MMILRVLGLAVALVVLLKVLIAILWVACLLFALRLCWAALSGRLKKA